MHLTHLLLASSTRMTSLRSLLALRLMTECTVLSRVDHASLWKMTITDALGNLSG